jgi:hypothetical protein
MKREVGIKEVKKEEDGVIIVWDESNEIKSIKSGPSVTKKFKIE